MHYPPICQTLECGSLADCPRAPAGRRGFSLVELLSVMAIVSLLMAASSALFRTTGSRAGEPALRMARCIELARAQAVASSQRVAIRFQRNEGGELVMHFLRSRPGLAGGAAKELRRPERFADVVLAAGLTSPKLLANSQHSHPLAAEESLVITADGQVLLGTGARGFPEPAAQLLPSIHLGVQPTRRGQVVAAEQRDVAIVQIQCASGSARVLLP